MDLQVKQMIEKKISAGEAFTSACISHTLIHDDPMIRHREVNDIIKQMWDSSDFDNYCRTSISVWPDGVEQKAFLYHPVGYDISTFQDHSRNLNRNSGATIPHAPPKKNSSSKSSMSVPKHLVVGLGWKPHDGLAVLDVFQNKTEIHIFRYNGLKPKKRVGKDGRVRLFGSIISELGSSPVVSVNATCIVLRK